MSKFRSFNTLLSLLIDMKKYKKELNEDIVNNYRLCKIISEDIVRKIKVPFEINGTQNIPSEGPTLIASNHKSFFDIFTLVYAIDRPMSFAAAKELMSYPYVKRYINGIECVLIDRKTTDLKKMKEQLQDMERIINKNGLILFPEGECSYDNDDIIEFKKGGFMNTIKNNVTIVPTYINYEGMSRIGKWMIPEGKTSIIFGESFTPKDISNDKISTLEVANYTRKKVLELRSSMISKEIS